VVALMLAASWCGERSFLKKRTKKLLSIMPIVPRSFHRLGAAPKGESFLLLFFKKEGLPF
jgi:hypothetical protein